MNDKQYAEFMEDLGQLLDRYQIHGMAFVAVRGTPTGMDMEVGKMHPPQHIKQRNHFMVKVIDAMEDLLTAAVEADDNTDFVHQQEGTTIRTPKKVN